MIRTQFSIVLAFAALRSEYFRRSSWYSLSDAREESSCHHRCSIPEPELLCWAVSFRGAWPFITGKWRRAASQTCRYDDQKESSEGNIQFSKTNSLICIFMLACSLWRARNCCDIEPLLLIDRSSFKILASGSRYFVFSTTKWIDEMTYSIEHIRSKIADRWPFVLMTRKISSTSICIWTNARSSVDPKRHRSRSIATVFASSRSWSSFLFSTIRVQALFTRRRQRVSFFIIYLEKKRLLRKSHEPQSSVNYRVEKRCLSVRLIIALRMKLEHLDFLQTSQATSQVAEDTSACFLKTWWVIFVFSSHRHSE